MKTEPVSAFTLRLTTERHLRLRLASAVAGISSQRVLETALDDYLQNGPWIEGPAQQEIDYDEFRVKRGPTAAFTLRLDMDRLMQLHFASVVADVSAQKILEDALDAYVVARPKIEALAQQATPIFKR